MSIADTYGLNMWLNCRNVHPNCQKSIPALCRGEKDYLDGIYLSENVYGTGLDSHT